MLLLKYDRVKIADLISEEVQKFIRENEQNDLLKLLLSMKSVHNVPMSVVVDQIKSRKKAKTKLASWYHQEGIIFPPPLSLEQSSSEITGQYKASLFSGSRLIDLTGGMGIDTSFFSKVFEQIKYVERQELLVEVFKHNCQVLGIENIAYLNGDGVTYLRDIEYDYYDVIFLDPARRDQDNQKVFAIESCEPDVVQLLPLLTEKAKNILIKLSPMLDIKHSLNHLKSVKEIHVVAVENECKELLFFVERGFEGEAKIKTVNIEKGEKQKFDFILAEEQSAESNTGLLGKFLYEPNVALLKAGAFKLPTDRFEIRKLDNHTHLYTSDEYVADFPGKSYRINKSYQPQKKAVKGNLKDQKISVKTRNYPESAEAVRKKYGLKDGDEKYVFFCQVSGHKMVIECLKY